MKMARDLYGTKERNLAFVIGCGPSIEKAERLLANPHPNSIRIALNDAIGKVAAEYWFFIDGDAYLRMKDHPNAKAAIRVGVEKFAEMYDKDTYVWERALKLPEDIHAGKLVHRATSLIGATSFAARLSCPRICYVGCDHTMPSADYLAERERMDPTKNWKGVYAFTFRRINDAFMNRAKWLPPWATVVDASGGNLPITQTFIHKELGILDRYWKKVADGCAVGA
jgi:hypothetical protein